MNSEMNSAKRAKMIMAMEYIVRQCNREDLIDPWLMCGVADGDIKFGETDYTKIDPSYYEDDDDFSEIMALFLRIMTRANESGGLYCNYVVSKRPDRIQKVNKK